MATSKLSDSSRKVLDVLRERGADGYTVMKRAGVTAEQLVAAVQEFPQNLLKPDAKAYAQILLSL